MPMNDLMDHLRLFRMEWATFRAFSSLSCNSDRRLVFYSEHAAYGKFFMPILELLRGVSAFSFLTSDPADPVFKFAPDQIKAHYIKNLLGGLSPQLDARAIVMTMPDLDQYHIKRSQKVAEHIYLFHALVSTHMIYRKGAFDHYDTILCAGPHHVEEIRRTESVYGLKPKKLMEAGYPLLDQIDADYQTYAAGRTPKAGEAPVVLIAPSWAHENIMVSCLEPLAKSFVDAGFRVIVRPHPEFLKRFPKVMRAFQGRKDYMGQVEYETHSLGENSLFEADVLVTDWSGISLEYALATERPVLFVDTPRKVLNPEYEKLGIDPLEVRVRRKIGQTVRPEKADSAAARIQELIQNRNAYREAIVALGRECLFNRGCSAGFIADYLKRSSE